MEQTFLLHYGDFFHISKKDEKIVEITRENLYLINKFVDCMVKCHRWC